MSKSTDRVYSLIFVDDEDIVREGISTRVDWGANGFNLAGVFGNGLEALSFLEKEKVDVVLSDISMPKMDGLALSEAIAERYPQTIVLLLTGFEEFEYAQEAVRHRVKEFLLKPITAEELGNVLSRTRSELNRLRDAEIEQERLQEQLEASLPLLKERFFYSLVSGRIDKKDISRRSGFFGWEGDNGDAYLVAIASLPDEWEELTRLSLGETARKLTDDGDSVFANRGEDLVLLLRGADPTALENRMQKVADSLFAAAVALSDSPVCIGIGELVHRQEDLNRSYLGAGNAVDHARILGITQVRSIEEVRRKSRVSQEAFISRARKLVKALREGGHHSARQALNDVFRLFEQSYLTPSDAVSYLARLQYHLADFVDEMGMSETGDLAELALTAEPRRFTRLDEARRYFDRKIEFIEEQVKLRRKDAVLSRIDRARAIIAERFTDRNFSLQDICSELYLSTSQFSALFKEGTGHTFVEYLTEVRIDEARKLLKSTDKRSYEIAENVGYQDPRYFSSIFKKVTGMTTTEYRRSLEN